MLNFNARPQEDVELDFSTIYSFSTIFSSTRLAEIATVAIGYWARCVASLRAIK